MNDNIVITGLGIISAIGVGKDAVLQSLREKRSGIGTMRHLVSSHHELPVGEVNRSNDELKADLGIDTTTEVSRIILIEPHGGPRHLVEMRAVPGVIKEQVDIVFLQRLADIADQVPARASLPRGDAGDPRISRVRG